jgi:hypothetical protein
MRRLIDKLLILLILINFIYVFSGVIHYPLRHIDVYSIWLLKAKAFFIYGGFPLEFLKTVGYSHPQYPVLLPFIFSLIYRFAGGVNEYYVLAAYPFVYLIILYLAFKFFIQLNLSKTQSLFFVYLYSMLSPLLAQGGREHAGMADIILTLIYWLVLILTYKIIREKKKKLLWLIIALIAIASQIKFEGVFLTWIIFLLPIKMKKKILWGFIAATPTIVWMIMRNHLGIPQDYRLGFMGLTQIIPEVLIVLRVIVVEMLNIRNWYVFWIAFWSLMIIQRSKDRLVRKIIEPTLLLISLSFIVMYVLIQLDTAAQVSSSVDRIMLQLSPFFYSMFVHRVKLLLRNV